MAIFTGGKSTAINSPRHLTLRHARRVIGLKKQSLGLLGPDEEVTEPTLAPGEEKVDSYWAPGLEAGPSYSINVTQTIKTPNQDESLVLQGQQDFTVDAPQFTLPEGSIHSVYPPSGYSEDHRILPHVVLTDPHLPWERRGSPKTPEHLGDRNRVPWLAVFSFTQDELKLSAEALASMFQKTSDQLQKPVKQSSTLAINMTVADLCATTDMVTPVSNLQPSTIQDARGDFIFVPAELFTSLFSTFDQSSQRQVPASPDTMPYQFLSHVRNINTTGMAVSGVEDVGIFSVVLGNRAGPLDNLAPATVSVHLVSIEGVEAMQFPISQPYVALCSLHSWTYTVLPPRMLNVPDAMEALGRTLGVLRPPESVIAALKARNDRVSDRIACRLDDGYSLVTYRTQTGERSVALYRGPLTPTVVPPLTMNHCSNSGIDLQILDKEVGIMDVSYSSAWQLGRTLALGDEAFTAALMRLRRAIHTGAMKASKIRVVQQESADALRTRTDLLKDLPTMVTHLHQIPGLGFQSPQIGKIYLEEAIKLARHLAQSPDGSMYDEHNAPNSNDWMVVLKWLMDRMFLDGVPAHYLISDPFHLEPESLRFFSIDQNWVDALIDGALSLGNHQGDDPDRAAIKAALNDYIQQGPQLLDQETQVPSYGFFLRSDLVTMFPDLRVKTLPQQSNPPKRAPLLRHEIITDGVMLCLLDRTPGSEDFTGLTFTQPPHQQRFAVARGLDVTAVKVDIRRQYTVDESIRDKDVNQHDPLTPEIKYQPDTADNLFIWGSQPGTADLRILRLPRFADVQLQYLQEKMGTYDAGSTPTKYFDDDTATSALFALQMNDPIYYLEIGLQGNPALQSLAAPPRPRTLRFLEPARVAPLLPTGTSSSSSSSPQPPDEPPAKDDDRGPVTTLFSRPAGYHPGPHILASLGPHVRAIRTRNLPSPQVTGDDTPAQFPKYTCSVVTSGLSYVQVGDNLPQDLIFAIGVSENDTSTYQLTEFDVRIRLGPVNPTIHTLMQDYDGPGPRMLDNLRFNVLPQFDHQGGDVYLLLRLLPRSATGRIEIRKVREMGFLLSLATVNLFPDHQTLVRLDTMAYYTDPSHPTQETNFDANIINSKA
ncbi:hypothetical protein EYZ11_008793 [Aspergillus tanneri]|uniref:Uncharacterized protein n=1 Tax=Aspergillus tanneri TaxID=1220188 RepID=A0A4S3J9W3_9EURO|nr:hypothetical protein EYZ11_008793 [Aspergillus tanneri]